MQSPTFIFPLTDNIMWGLIMTFFTPSEYLVSFAMISKYHYDYLVRNKEFVKNWLRLYWMAIIPADIRPRIDENVYSYLRHLSRAWTDDLNSMVYMNFFLFIL